MSSPEPFNFGRKIKELKRLNKKGYAKLSADLKISRDRIIQLEDNEREPTEAERRRFATYYTLPVEEFGMSESGVVFPTAPNIPAPAPRPAPAYNNNFAGPERRNDGPPPAFQERPAGYQTGGERYNNTERPAYQGGGERPAGNGERFQANNYPSERAGGYQGGSDRYQGNDRPGGGGGFQGERRPYNNPGGPRPGPGGSGGGGRPGFGGGGSGGGGRPGFGGPGGGGRPGPGGGGGRSEQAAPPRRESSEPAEPKKPKEPKSTENKPVMKYTAEQLGDIESAYLRKQRDLKVPLTFTFLNGKEYTGVVLDFTPFTVHVQESESGQEVILRKLAMAYYRKAETPGAPPDTDKE